MKLRNLGRFGLALASVLCMFAAVSSTAFAAGKPTAQTQINFGSSTIDVMHMESTVNPNGATTTVTLQYRKSVSEAWKTVKTEKIGSGIEPVTLQWTAFSTPWAENEFSTTAVNSFGTVSSVIHNDAHWVQGKPYVGEANSGTISTEGSLSISWPGHGTVSCAESGSGYFGPSSGKTESYSLNAYNCNWEIGSEVVCHPHSFVIELDKSFQAKEIEGLEFCPGSGSEWIFPIKFPEPLPVLTPVTWGEKTPVQGVTISGPIRVANGNATLTITSKWSLSGPYVGHKFGVVTSF